ncbi:hypothetical protein HRG84_13440 [Flavisolibacter sp. BT320]|nr:hypothetical protein [Flavisolibacter longurius]
MAARTYPVNPDGSLITLEIQIGTPAGWTAKVYKPVPPASSGQFIVLAGSEIQGGAAVFPESNLATGAELSNTHVIVQIIGDFRLVSGVDFEQLKNDSQFLRNIFFVNYILRGGPLGEQIFDYDNDDYGFSSDGQIIVIDKYVNFV